MEEDGNKDQLEEQFILEPGTLYLVGTPIGNLADLSPRAASALAQADLIAAEDTRQTMKLLARMGLRKRLVSYHQHNRRQREESLLTALEEGLRLVLVSDAGMPAISDPGADLVAACVAAGYAVSVIPGPSAAFVALAGSGLATGRFAFEGFLPASGRERKTRLAGLSDEPRTMVLFEAPHRIARTVNDLAANGFGPRRLVIARELTKLYETFYRATVAEFAREPDKLTLRGEFVLILEGKEEYTQRCPEKEEAGSKIAATLLEDLLNQGLTAKAAVQKLARQGYNRNELYNLALEIKGRQVGDREPD